MQNDPSHDWQQPTQAASGAPFQAVTPEPQLAPQDNQAVQPKAAASPTPPVADTEVSADNSVASAEDEVLVRWQSAEHLYRERTALWYGVLAMATLGLMTIAYFVFSSLTFTILLPVMALALVVYVRRPPEIVDYVLSRKGLYVRDRLFSYDQFRSFGVVAINGVNHIALIPRKRFQLGQNIYFPEEVGEQIVDMLAARLPMKDIKPDFIDKLLAKLHL